MVLLISNLFLLLSLAVTITISYPTRQLRTVKRPRVTITQKSAAVADDPTEFSINAETRECLPVRDSNIPITITMNVHSRESRNLLGYSSYDDCQMKRAIILNDTLSARSPKEVNAREKICSFYLQRLDPDVPFVDPVTVKFSYGNTGIGPRHFTTANPQCFSLCSSNESPLHAYPQNVEILVNNQPADPEKHFIKLYTKTECESSPLLPSYHNRNVKHGDHLVDITRKSNKIVNFIMLKGLEEDEQSSENYIY